ncbi:MAG TPA: FAD-dependent oxidoreductase, partial [Acidimicrobiales bacterium]|nr:FAD-dependent oxidoreductase [Acidimicrobiales bacterium]
MEHGHEIHVIGGGLAGLAAAAFAARAGASVVVHETRGRLGGRATTDEHEGFLVDQGPHALYRGGPAERALAELGICPRGAVPRVEGVFVRDEELHRAPTGPASLLRTSAMGGRDKAELAKVLGTLARQRPSEHAQRTTAEWVDGVARRRRVRETLHLLSRLTTYANRPQEMSADVTVQMLQQGTGPGVVYLDGGWQQLVGALEEVATRAGARIVRDDPVRELPDAAAVVAAAGGPANAGALIGNELAAGPSADVACLDVGLRGAPPHPIALGLDPPMYASHHSIAAGRAPEGCSLVATAEYLGPGVEPDRHRLARWVRTIGVAPEQVVTERYLHRMVACSAIPVA